MTVGLRFGYGTNGFADHRLDDALGVLAELGYQGVALTLDHHHLDPYRRGLRQRVAALAGRLAELKLAVVIETGARYLLDPTRKHAPTLLDEDPAPRLDLLRRAVLVGADLGAEAVSFWAGVRPPALSGETAWDRLRSGCADVVTAADKAGVRLGLEPEPGMHVATIADWRALWSSLGEPPSLGVTLDIGHCIVTETRPVAECVTAIAPHLVHVQIEDMRRGVHEHLPFGAGEIEFVPVLRALRGYPGLVSVELPRHSHAAPALAAESIGFLRQTEREAG